MTSPGVPVWTFALAITVEMTIITRKILIATPWNDVQWHSVGSIWQYVSIKVLDL
jgi:hypothetical protein